ncbi:MAG: hypothetical protein KDL87_11715 [Verrucomicrobiae bacterium]|nr:hypothetical protein [Verrucomicrobiae bacterium]
MSRKSFSVLPWGGSPIVALLIGWAIGFGLPMPSQAHPLPDLPVRSYFLEDGSVEIRVEVDPRCFEKDPEAEGFLMKAMIDNLTADEQAEMKTQAEKFVGERLRFLFDPKGELKPQFDWEFRKLGDSSPLLYVADEVVLVGVWKLKQREGISAYRIEALELTPEKMGIPLNVNFLNFVGGKQVERFAVLFPGETSFAFDVGSLKETNAAN